MVNRGWESASWSSSCLLFASSGHCAPGGAAHSPATEWIRRRTKGRNERCRLDMIGDSVTVVLELSALSPVEGEETRFHSRGNRAIQAIETETSHDKILGTLETL